MKKLFIDIGNTNVAMAAVEGNRIVKRYFIRTARERIETRALKRLLGRNRDEIETVVIVSVVPEFLRLIRTNIRKVLPHAKVRIVGNHIKVPMKIEYRDPKQVGQDRLVTAYSAYEQTGKATLVIDFGTAVTFDLVSRDGVYKGGTIFPGLRLELNALTANAALLPKTELRDIKGDLHVHSTWSDGGSSIEEIVKKAMAMGYEYIAITDHSQGLKIAGGLNKEELRLKRNNFLFNTF